MGPGMFLEEQVKMVVSSNPEPYKIIIELKK